jgi:PilZ domain
MPEFVRHVRRRRHTKVWVSGEGISEQECSVCDISASGMKLISTLADKIPNRFTVRFNATSPNNGPCRVVWRKRSSIGVKFDR